MRSPADMDILVLDITNRCFLRCSNCTRAVAHQAKPYDMDLDTFRKACRSLKGWLVPGKVVGLIGGEPTMHPRFEDICEIMMEVFERKPLNYGLKPIKDFNAYANERLFDRSNGLGLWTSLGESFYKHLEVVHRCFSHWNTNTHEHNGRHAAMWIDRKTYCEKYGVSDAEWERARDSCWVNAQWSGSITPHGAHFCEVAGTIDNLFYQGKHAWPVEPGWWKRKPPFTDQLHLCNHCSLAQPGPSSIANEDRDIICEISLEKLKQAGSPAVKRGKYEAFK